MKWVMVMLASCSLVLGLAGPGWAQNEETRPASTTFWGDTGLWFVPTAEVLQSGGFSISVQRTDFDFEQGNTNVSFWPLTAAAGAGPVEIFGALRMVNRIDRDTSPLLFAGSNENEAGGLVNEYPSVHESWTGTHLGDLYVGAKANLMSQKRSQPLALALRGTVKVPTADKDVGAGTGEYDGFVDVIASREFTTVELTGFSGVALRGDPADFDLSDGIRWGAGAGFPTRRSLRASVEAYGEWFFDDAIHAPAGVVVGTDGSLSPSSSLLKKEVNTAFGVTWQHPSGVLLGAALNYRFGMDVNDPAAIATSTSGDGWGMQFRLGFHGGVNTFVPRPVALAPPPPPPVEAPPAPTPAPAPPPPAPAANRAPSVKAVCEPCSVEAGQTATLRAQSNDPDGDPLTFRWSATGGTLADTRAATTTWGAETAPGLITFTVTVEDASGAVATDTVTIDVSAPENVEFEELHFDFDSYKLRQDALPLLEPIILALKQRPQLRLSIEGHTCNIGATAYNVALGERRAEAVRDYLVKQGIDGARLSTVSYGEENPAHDNVHADMRRLNRRTSFVVRLAGEDNN